MKGLLLAGGHGTRLRPLTFTTNKHLIPIANKPLIFYGIETLANSGIKDIGIIIGHTDIAAKEVKDIVGDGSNWNVNITYIFQDAPRGLAHAVKTAQEFLTSNNPDGKFCVYLGDNIVKGGIHDFVDHFKNSDSDSLILFRQVPDPQRFGVPEFKDGKLLKLIEKPKIPPSNFGLVGVYFFNSLIFEEIDKLKPSWRGELEITEAIQGLMNSAKKVDYKIIERSWWKDPGDPEGILEANRLMLEEIEPYNKGTIEDGAKIIGRVVIEEGAVIKKGSIIRGPSIIGRNAVIDSAYIGPFTSIGNRVVVKSADIESSIVIDGAQIKCNKRIIDSLVGKDAVINSSSFGPNGIRLILGEKSFMHL